MSKPASPKEKKAGIGVPASGDGPMKKYSRRAGDFHEKESNSKIWLISFTDVMALMLTFFVMLFAMSQPETENWNEVSAALKNEFSKYYGPSQMRGPIEEINLDRIDFNEALNIKYLNALLDSTLKENEKLGGVRLFERQGELVVSMPEDLLFLPGQSSVKAEGARALYILGGALSRIRNKIEVVGHADPRPVSGENTRFESNWELSFARAATVAGILNSVGYERKIDVRGLSSGRYEDLQAIPDEQTRLDLSRRVDIIVKDHDGRESRFSFMPLIPDLK